MKVVRAGVIALLFAVLLSAADRLTYPVIADNKTAYASRQIAMMVDGRDFLTTDSGYEVFESDQLFGFVEATTTRRGYNGDIHLLVAYDLSARVLAVQVTEHRETPGLGDAIDSAWIDTFRGRQADGTDWELAPEGDFDGITGATITSRAIITAVAEVVHP